MSKNFTLVILIILLCSMFIGCREVNEPNVPEEPPVNVEPPIEDPPETFFEGPIIVTGGSSGGDLALPAAKKISRVLIESDLIFVGKVHREAGFPIQPSQTEITEVLKGATNEKEASIPAGGSDGDINIYFLRKEGDGFVFTTNYYYLSTIQVRTSYNGAEYYEDIDATKLLLNMYKKNRELFSGKQDLINLYPQLGYCSVASRVLDDLYYLLDETDVEFFATGLQSSNIRYHIFTLEMLAWNIIPTIEELKELIANVFFMEPYLYSQDLRIQYALRALGKYGDKKYKDIFFEYLNHEDFSIRNNAAQAIVQIPDLETLLAFVPYYINIGIIREDIIYYLNEIEDNEILLPVLYKLREIETEDRIINYINNVIASRTGG